MIQTRIIPSCPFVMVVTEIIGNATSVARSVTRITEGAQTQIVTHGIFNRIRRSGLFDDWRRYVLRYLNYSQEREVLERHLKNEGMKCFLSNGTSHLIISTFMRML